MNTCGFIQLVDEKKDLPFKVEVVLGITPTIPPGMSITLRAMLIVSNEVLWVDPLEMVRVYIRYRRKSGVDLSLQTKPQQSNGRAHHPIVHSRIHRHCPNARKSRDMPVIAKS